MNDFIIQAERQLIAAILESNVDVLDNLLYDKIIFTNQMGQLIDKQTDMQMHRTGILKVIEMNVREQLIHQVENVAIVSAQIEVSGYYNKNQFIGQFRYTRIWKRFEDGLKVIAATCVAIPEVE